MKENGYCIWDSMREKWWNPRSSGYTGNLRDAGVYTKSKAESICAAPYTNETMYLKSNLMQSQTLRNMIYGVTGV